MSGHWRSRHGRAPAGPGSARAGERPEDGAIYAAVDLGTNNCRLLVARRVGGGFRVVDAFSRVVRLGEGITQQDTLSPAAMDRTLEALAICAEKMRRRGVTHARSVATEACRRARNVTAFLDRVEQETGLAIEVISPEEEALLMLGGCAPLLGRDRPFCLIFDIGGGSTELIWARQSTRGPRVLGWASLPCGVVRFAERFGGDPLPPADYASMVEEVADLLAPFEAEYRIGAAVATGAVQMLGTSGTVTTLAGIHLRLPRYSRPLVDGTHLSFAAIGDASAALAGMDLAARADHPCIGPARADLVVAGCAILEALCRIWPVGRLRVADRGLREGILSAFMAAPVAAP